MQFAMPLLPAAIFHAMEQIITETTFDQSAGGQFIPKPPSRVPFRGVVMPMSNEDLKHAQAGTYTHDTRKVYTNGHALSVGAQVVDLFDGAVYTVTQELTHGPIHPLKRYQVERKGVSAQR